MLVMSRARGESVVIGNDIRITVVGIRGSQVRLGVAAPTHVPVHRQEVHDAIHGREPQSSMNSGTLIPPNPDEPVPDAIVDLPPAAGHNARRSGFPA
jgi:carbon storage regulator